MGVTALIFTKLMLSQQFFVNNSCTDFHEDPTVDSRRHSVTDGRIRALLKAFFFHFLKNT
jgi:hypothetical protein